MNRSLFRPSVLLVCVTLLFAFTQRAFAQDYTEEEISALSSVELISEQAWIQPGTSFTLGLKMVMKPDWHSYWLNSGDAGEPTEIDWTLPDGFEAGAIQWPYPEAIDAPPLRSYGYSNEVILLTDLEAPANLAAGTDIQVDALAYWLICADVCIPVEEEVSITLPVRTESPPTTEHHVAFDETRLKHPVSLEGWSYEATSNSGSYVLSVTPPAGTRVNADGAYFFVDSYSTLKHSAPQPITRDGDRFLIALQQSEYARETAESLSGVLVAGEGNTWDADGQVRALIVDASVTLPSMQPVEADAPPSIALLLLLAMAGGLLLNLMPCVFPVISLKILGFARQADENNQSIRRHGFVFAAGVVISFLVLAGLLLALRAAGSQIGWGFQLQSPLFVAGMALLFFAIGLNLLGVFEVGGFSIRSGAPTTASYRKSFFDGILATLIATPCTAPFMGAALGAAVVLPTPSALLVFAALGIGMAAPYVLLSLMPSLIQKLPRPGAWMETLKQVLAFPMIATTIWLVWVFGNQTGIDGATLLLFGLFMLGLALWIVGRWPAFQISSRTRIISRTFSVLFFIGGLGFISMGASTDYVENTSSEPADALWQPFSQATINDLTAAGQPVFIDFTAAWCLTCQVNKRTTLNNEKVLAAFEQKGVHLIQADWTNRNAEITAALDALGRNGVPVYVLYDGSGNNPVILPEILTEDIVLDALNALPDRSLASL